MSSISGSDSSTSSRDEVRRNREEYRKNEAELVKKHAKEMRRLNERHAMEVENLKQSHDKQLEEVQKHAQDAITDRDNKYQSEMENLRAMHRKQLQATTDEAQKREDQFDQTVKRESQERNIQNDQRVKSLNEEYARENKNRNEELTRSLNQYREDSAHGLAEQKDKLDKAYGKELDSMRDDRNRKVAELQGNYDNYRRYAEGSMKDQKIKHMEDMQRASDSQMHAVRKERAERAAAEERWRNASSGSLKEIREHYNDGLKKNREDFDAARSRMEDSYHAHVEPEMQTLRTELEDTKDKAVRDQRQADFRAAREKAQFRDSYSKNIENYKMQRDEAVRTGNDRRHHDIETLNDRNAKDMADTHRYYNQKLDDQNRRLRSEYQSINNDFKDRNDQIQSLADVRVKNIIADTEEEKQRLARNETEAHDTMRRQQAEQLRDMRTQTDAEKAGAVERIKERAKQKEVAHAERVAQMQQSHQREILSLQDQMVRERKAADENLRRTIDDMNRARKNELDQQMAKYEEKIRVMQNTQRDELHRVNRANEEKLSELAATTRKA